MSRCSAAKPILEGELSIVALANAWITISTGGEPTSDKPAVTLEPPSDPHHASSFLNIRVADIAAVYEQWRARSTISDSANQPWQRDPLLHARPPDGHLIEVGQLVGRAE